METKNVIDTLLDEAKEKAGISSDYALAMAMGIKKQTISHYRKGLCTPDDYAKSRISDLTGRTLREVIANIEAENEPNEEKRKYWKNLTKRVSGIAASLLLGVTINVTPTPSEAAPLAQVSSPNCILCKIADWPDIQKSHGEFNRSSQHILF